MSDNELIWVPKEIAKRYKDADNFEAQRQMVEEVIASKRREFKFSQESLDEDLLIFKAICMRHKQALQDAYEEQAAQLYKLWEDCGDIGVNISNHAKQLANEISPLRIEIQKLKDDLASIKALSSNMEPWLSSEFIGVITTVSKMDEKAKQLLAILLTQKEME